MSSIGSSSAVFAKRPRRAMATWYGVAAPYGVLVMLAVGALLTSRRLAGFFASNLMAPSTAVTAALTALILLGGRVAWRQASEPRRQEQLQFREQLVGWGGTAALILMFLGCSFPSFTYWNWILWLPLLIADHLQRDWFFGETPPTWIPRLIEHDGVLSAPHGATHPVMTTVIPLGQGRRSEPAPVETEDKEIEGAAVEANVLQQFSRIRDANGLELIYGALRAEFAVGQRTATLHVGFCPPLAALPAIEADPSEGPDASVKVTQVFTHGARLEVRLASPATAPCSVLIEMSATPNG